MIVYLTAFLFTILFASAAASNYRKWNRRLVATAEGDKPRVYSAELLRDFRQKYHIFFFLAFLPLFFVAAVRYDVGTDYFYTYIPNFYSILEGASPYSEWGFNFLNRFLQLFTRNAQWLIVVTSFIYSFLLVRTIVRYSEDAAVSVAVLLFSCLYFAALNNVRQAIASVIVFAAFPYIVKPCFWKFCLCILCAMLFHWSAIVMLVPFLVVRIRFIRRYFLFFALLGMFALPVICSVAEMLLRNTKYAYYFVSDFNNGRATTVNIVYHLFFFLFACGFCYKVRMKDERAYVLLVMQYLAFWVSSVSIFIRISEMIMRTALFFQIFQILLVPHCCALQKTPLRKFAVVGTYVLLYGVYMIYYIVLKNYHSVLPYHWIF